MKKGWKGIVLGIVLFFILVSFSSYFVLADSTTSNVKSYDSTTKTVTVSNKGAEIAKVKLDTPLVYNVMRGKDRLVAEFTIDNSAGTSNVFNNMEFYNLKDSNKKIERQFTYKYKVVTGTKDVPYYHQVCLIINPKNDSGSYQNCTNEIAGYNKEDVYAWKTLNTNNLPTGKTTVGIFTDVYPGDSVEWIPTLFGVKINEWAIWEESLNNGLLHWIQANQTYNKMIDLVGTYNGTNEAGITYIGGGPEGTGQAIFPGGANGGVTFSDTDFPSGTTSFTLLIRASTASGQNNPRLFSRGFGPNQDYGGWIGYINSLNPYGMDFLYNTVGGLTATVQYNNQYVTDVFMRNSSGSYIYVDGVLRAQLVPDSRTVTNIGQFVMGCDVTSTYCLHGNVSDIAIWDRGLNASDILYLNDTSYTPTLPDTTPPQTSQPIIIPSTPTRSNSLQCNAILTDNMQTNLTVYWKWYKNGVSYLSGNVSVTNGTNSLITTLNAGNTTKGDNWICEITPYDGTNLGDTSNSTTVTILNAVPTHTTPLLSTPSASHPSNENLTCTNQSTYDADNDKIVNIYNWIRNGISLLSLNLPFESNFNDYTGNGNDGISHGAVSLNLGKVGNAVSFNGNGNISILDDDSIDFTNQKTWEIWFKRSSTGNEVIFDKGDGTKSNYKLEFLNDKLKFSYSLAIGDVINNQEINTQSQFNEGSYSNTHYNSTIEGVRLVQGQTSGSYTSKVFDADSVAEWNNLSWSDNMGAILTLIDNGEGIYKSVNQGLNWTLVNSSYGGAGTAVEIIESINGTLYIVNNAGGGGEVWKSDNFGVSWTKQTSDFNGAADTYDAMVMTGDGGYIYVIDSNESVWRSSNKGVNWTEVNSDLDSKSYTADIKGAVMDNNGNIFVVNNDAAVYKSTDNGVSWTEVNSDYNGAYGNSATDLGIDSNDNLYILNMQEIWKSSNGGQSWNRVNDDFNLADTNNGMAMTIDVNNFIYIIDSSEDVYRSTDGGVSWNLLVSNMNGARGDVMSMVAYDQPVAKFQVRSCDDAACSGEQFVGPDGTSSTYYLDSPENLNIPNNQYFQFRTYFETYDTSYSPEVYNTNITYITQSTDLGTSLTSTTEITDNNWHLATISYDNNSGINNFKLYLDGSINVSSTESRLPGYKDNGLEIGNGFNGMLDEFKIYDVALSPEQISADYNLKYNTLVSQETSAGETYACQVTPNDGEADGIMINSNNLSILVSVVFNVTSGEDGSQIPNFNINCNNSFSASGVSSPYTPGFSPGNYECTFSKQAYFNKTINFVADIDKTINVKVSKVGGLTYEEHTWLEAIYNCLYSGDCSLYNLLLEVNQTASNIWQQTRSTDNNVIVNETLINKIVDSTHNLTIDYSVNIPIKAGYSKGTYLPVRIGYWFLNNDNTTCYNQGTKPTGVEEPYCQPLIVETLGPMGGSVNFTVKLHPSLPVGNYSIKRMIDIDPNNVWINYGQETIGTFVMKEELSNYGIAVEKTGESNPSVVNTNNQQQSSSSSGRDSSSSSREVTNVYNTYNTVTNAGPQTPSSDGVIHLNNPTGITGGVIGTIISQGQIIIAIGIIGGILAAFILSKIKIKLKKK